MEKEFIVDGMMCANCKATVEKSLRHLKGISKVYVNLANKHVLVSFDDKLINFLDMQNALKKEGYEASEIDDLNYIEQKRKIVKQKRNVLIVTIILSIIELYASMGVMIGLPFFFVSSNKVLYVLIQFILILPIIILNFSFYKKGFINLLRNHPSMESLVSLGSLASLIYSIISFIKIIKGYDSMVFLDSVAMIICLVTLGKYLESKALSKSSDAIEMLLKKTPNEVVRITNKKEEVISIKEVKINDRLLVKAGENIAVDGIVISGECEIDESLLTGESISKYKTKNDKVYAGTSLINGNIIYKCEKTGEETYLNKIVKEVKSASMSKAPIENLTDKVANVFTKVILSIALLTLIFWWIFKDFNTGFNNFVTVLVIACPCSLGLATPTCIIVGSGVGARNNILFKDATSLQTLCDVKTFFFDKTGTLTTGEFIVSSYKSYIDKNELFKIVKSIEKYSLHPLGKSLYKYIDKKLDTYEVKDFKNEIGKGVSGFINNKKVLIIKDEKIDNKINVFVDKKLIGEFYLTDNSNVKALNLLIKLRSEGNKVVLLSGDNKTNTEELAKSLKIEEYYYGVLPTQKAEIINKAKKDGKVAMIGDGVNDSVALTSADVSISFTNATDIAVSSSLILLTSRNLIDIYEAKRLSKKTMKTIKQNLFFAFFYNSLAISFAVGLFYPLTLSPLIGALAMSLSSISVVLNSLRINNFKKEEI